MLGDERVTDKPPYTVAPWTDVWVMSFFPLWPMSGTPCSALTERMTAGWSTPGLLTSLLPYTGHQRLRIRAIRR